MHGEAGYDVPATINFDGLGEETRDGARVAWDEGEPAYQENDLDDKYVFVFLFPLVAGSHAFLLACSALSKDYLEVDGTAA